MINVKRYAVLAGDQYYPSGWNDYRGSFDDLPEAVIFANAKIQGSNGFEWFEIVDLASMTVVARG